MKRILLVLCMLAMGLSIAWAQGRVSGKVSGTDGEPLEGVAVLIKGTTVGQFTGADGTFTLEVPNSNDVLVFSYIGYKVQEIVVGSQKSLSVTLEEDILGVDEVVITGYLAQRRGDITGAVGSVSAEDIADVPGIGVQTALRGRVAGVNVIQSSGTPGSSIDVRLRGSTSITASNQPLYVVDGVPIISANLAQVGVGGQDQNTLADLNPNDIESIEVLKDASMTAIYGTRAANGVVLINTKKGRAGNTKVNFNAQYGVQEAWRLIPMADSGQFRDFLEEITGSRTTLVGALNGNTFWQDSVFGQGSVQDYSFNVSGGNEKTNFYTSASYFNNQGIIRNTGFERYSGRLNVTHRAGKRFTVGTNLSFTRSINQRQRNDNNIRGVVSVSILWPSTIPVRNEDGSFASAFGWNNPVNNIENYKNFITTNRVIGNTYATYNIADGLDFKATVGIDAIDLRETEFQPSVLNGAPTGQLVEANTSRLRWLQEYTLNYNKTFSDHSLNALVGVGFQEDAQNQNSATVVDFPTDDFTGLSSGATPTGVTGAFTGDRINSFFGNVVYNYADKYFLTVTARADGSSRFGVNNRYAFFPGFSAAWKLHNEDFIGDFFNELKLRAGFGINGNNQIGNFDNLPLLGAAGVNYVIDGSGVPGIVPTQLGNPDLRWETTAQTNIGVDFAILDSRIGGSIDFFLKQTSDLLLDRPIPTTSGFTTVIQNIGGMENRGIDILLNFLPVAGGRDGFNWEIVFNGGILQNRITELFDGQPIDAGFGSRIAEGQPLGAFYGYQTDGIFQNQEEIDAHAFQTNGTAPGDIRFKDISGGPGPDGIPNTDDDLPPDGIINDADRTFLGTAIAPFSGGITNILSYKGVELNFFFQFNWGNSIYNNNGEFAEGMHSSLFSVTQRAWEGRWTQEGDDEDFPRAVAGDPNQNRRNSDRFVEDASYIRLKNLTLSYTLPNSVTRKFNTEKVRVYFFGQNLLTFTNYSWFDPEVSTFGNSNSAQGTDFLTYPQARTIGGGINLGF
ncbi:MAG: TonB-dependent receptor [Bacteroidia bacterium]|nr:TonB-dependent receptor [Bacteroidia bacterium]